MQPDDGLASSQSGETSNVPQRQEDFLKHLETKTIPRVEPAPSVEATVSGEANR